MREMGDGDKCPNQKARGRHWKMDWMSSPKMNEINISPPFDLCGSVPTLDNQSDDLYMKLPKTNMADLSTPPFR